MQEHNTLRLNALEVRGAFRVISWTLLLLVLIPIGQNVLYVLVGAFSPSRGAIESVFEVGAFLRLAVLAVMAVAILYIGSVLRVRRTRKSIMWTSGAIGLIAFLPLGS